MGAQGAELFLILVRDREAADQHLEAQLRATAFSVTTVDHGPDVLAQVVAAEPPAVVLDVPRGRTELLDLAPKIATQLGQIAPPVFAVVDSDEEELIERAFAQGVKDVLPRPVSGPLLRAKLQRHARRAESAAQGIGGYAIERVLGRGGMGVVYLAERDGRKYALKVLEAGPATDMESLARFRREMETLRRLSGPGIPRFFEAGRAGDAFFYVMEYVPGETLAERLRRAPLAEAEVKRLIADLAAALSVIHEAGLVHRDVKPGNVILTETGTATLIDYGLAKFRDDFSLTRQDEVLGTILYMAPELLRGEDAGPASDSFALGMTALHAALGQDPLAGSAAHVARQIMTGEVPRAADVKAFSKELAAVVDGLLEKDAKKRLLVAEAHRLLAPTQPQPEAPRSSSGERTSLLALTFVNGESAGRTVEFRAPRRIVIGRAQDVDVVVFDAKVSRRHCSITLDARYAHVKDLGSANGTFLNGAPVKIADLKDGDHLRVADTTIRIELAERSKTGTGLENAGDAAEPPAEIEESDLHVPGYELVRRVGSGASAAVYEARSTKWGGTFALKVMRPKVEVTVEDRQRFLREAATASALVHPNIVRLIERGEFAGTFYLVMEFIHGESLRSYVAKKGPLPVSFALHVTRQIASALELARTCRIVHRDVKPDNILLQEDGTAKLADFGLAKSTLTAGRSGLTHANLVLGTLPYMAPEQLTSSVMADHRADIYSLGATLHHMLVGRPPFTTATNPNTSFKKVLEEVPAPIHDERKDVLPVVSSLVARCLKKKPDERPQTAAEVVRLASQLLATVENRETTT